MTYQELIDAAKAYADRQDIEVSANIDVFILMAESKMNRLLKTRNQSTRVYAPTVEDAEYYGLPIDYLGMRDLQLDSSAPTSEHSVQGFEYVSPVYFNQQRDRPYSGKLYYTVIANQLQIYPKQSAGKSLEIVYYQRVPHLSAEEPLNWLSIEHPDIYLSGVISEIELFVKNHEVAQGWAGRMSLAIDELDNSDEEERWSGTPLTIKVL